MKKMKLESEILDRRTQLHRLTLPRFVPSFLANTEEQGSLNTKEQGSLNTKEQSGEVRDGEVTFTG
jgi:hypothetical protein